MKGIFKSSIISIISLLVFQSMLFAEEPVLSESDIRVIPEIQAKYCPEIPELNYKDFLYKQYSEDLKQYYMDQAQMKNPVITFYSYVPGASELKRPLTRYR